MPCPKKEARDPKWSHRRGKQHARGADGRLCNSDPLQITLTRSGKADKQGGYEGHSEEVDKKIGRIKRELFALGMVGLANRVKKLRMTFKITGRLSEDVLISLPLLLRRANRVRNNLNCAKKYCVVLLKNNKNIKRTMVSIANCVQSAQMI